MSVNIDFQINNLGSGRWTRQASNYSYAPAAVATYDWQAARRQHDTAMTLKLIGGLLLVLAALSSVLVLANRQPAGYRSFAAKVQPLGQVSFGVNVEPALPPTLASEPAAQPAAQPQPAPVPASSGLAQRSASDFDVRGLPSISVATIERVLAEYGSPAVGSGQVFYDLGVQYGVDPAFILAFFVHESTAGTAGAAVANLSVGNIRCVNEYRCNGGYAQYDSWVQSAEHWYKLITQSGLYCGAGSNRCTPDTIIPRYAPSADNNCETCYVGVVKKLVTQWRGEQ